ncbi:hypothetical protein SZ64_07230 [Erythrobacter sp. SG61-1L]|nr:hypothetical protein SZ64_07230 [Erythrobacter sp. SG61-1L]
MKSSTITIPNRSAGWQARWAGPLPHHSRTLPAKCWWWRRAAECPSCWAARNATRPPRMAAPGCARQSTSWPLSRAAASPGSSRWSTSSTPRNAWVWRW